MIQLTPVQRRLLALGILAIVLLLVFNLFLGPFLSSYLENREQIDRLEHQLAVYKRVAGSLDESQRQLSELSAVNPTQGMYLSESRPSLAAAQLQQELSKIINSSGGQLVSTQVDERTDAGPMPSVTVQVRLRCEIDELVQLFYALESHKPLFFTENLLISSTNRVSARSAQIRQRTSSATIRRQIQLPSLDVRFDLVAYTSKGAPL